MRIVVLLLVFGFMQGAYDSLAQIRLKSRTKKSNFEEVDLEQMIRRYFGKDAATHNSIEGIYSVSCTITKKSRNILTGREQFKVVERKDNYARVAILKDWPGSRRDFIEVSMSSSQANKYPIVGELEEIGEGNGYLYKHFEPDGSKMSFSMIFDYSELLEGQYSEMKKRKTITYKLSYLRIYPKASDLNVRNY